MTNQEKRRYNAINTTICDIKALARKYPKLLRFKETPGSNAKPAVSLLYLKINGRFELILKQSVSGHGEELLFKDTRANLGANKLDGPNRLNYLLRSTDGKLYCSLITSDGLKKVSLNFLCQQFKRLYISIVETVDGRKLAPAVSYAKFKKMNSTQKAVYINEIYSDLFDLAYSNKNFRVEKSESYLSIKYDNGAEFNFPVCSKGRKNMSNVSNVTETNDISNVPDYFDFYGYANDFIYIFDIKESGSVTFERFNRRDDSAMLISARTYFKELKKFYLVCSERLKERKIIQLVEL